MKQDERLTYSGTAKIVGCSPATVKKYCMEEVQINISKSREKIPFTKEIPLIEDVVLDWNDPDSLFCLNNEEIEECKKFNDERF